VVVAATLAVTVGALAIVGLMWANRRFAPRLYFPLRDIIYGLDSAVTWRALLLKLGIPFLTGLVIGWALSEGGAVAAAGACFLASFILVWPGFSSPERLSYEVAKRRQELNVIYVLFMLSYTLLGLAGGQLGLSMRKMLAYGVEHADLGGIGTAITSNIADFAKFIVFSLFWATSVLAWRRLFRKVQQ